MMTNSDCDSKPTKKKVRLTYSFATSGGRKRNGKRGLNVSRSIANKSLNKSKVMRTIRTNNSALAKKLNTVQVQLTKAEEQLSETQDSLQTAQHQIRLKESCLRDISAYFADITHLIVAAGKRLDEALNPMTTKLNVSSVWNNSQSAPLSTTFSLDEAEKSDKFSSSTVEDDPFVRRDKIPRTPPLGNISGSFEADNSKTLQSVDVFDDMEDEKRSREDSKLVFVNTARPVFEKRGKKISRDIGDAGQDIKQMTMVVESLDTTTTASSMETMELRDHEPDVLAEKMLNNIISHGITDSLQEEFAASPIPPPVIPTSKRPSSGMKRQRRSSMKSLSPTQPSQREFPTPPDMSKRRSSRKVSMSPTQPPSMNASNSEINNATAEQQEKSTVSTTQAIQSSLGTKDDLKEHVSPKVIKKKRVVKKPKQKESRPGKSKETENCETRPPDSSKPSTTSSNASPTPRTVVVESKKPGILKFSAPKPGNEEKEPGKVKRKKKTKASAAPKVTLVVPEETSKAPRIKSVFDFSMSDTMNETTKVPATLSEFREQANVKLFKNPKVSNDSESLQTVQKPESSKEDLHNTVASKAHESLNTGNGSVNKTESKPIFKKLGAPTTSQRTRKPTKELSKTSNPSAKEANNQMQEKSSKRRFKKQPTQISERSTSGSIDSFGRQSQEHQEGPIKPDSLPIHLSPTLVQEKSSKGLVKKQHLQPKESTSGDRVVEEQRQERNNSPIKRDNSPIYQLMELRVDVHRIAEGEFLHADDDEFQSKKKSASKTKRRFKRLLTFDESLEDSPKVGKQQKLEENLSSPMSANKENTNAQRSRRRPPVSYTEPKSNVKIRRGDPTWCRK